MRSWSEKAQSNGLLIRLRTGAGGKDPWSVLLSPLRTAPCTEVCGFSRKYSSEKMTLCTKTYGFSNKKVRQRANNRVFALNRTFFGENRYTFEHSRKTFPVNKVIPPKISTVPCTPCGYCKSNRQTGINTLNICRDGTPCGRHSRNKPRSSTVQIVITAGRARVKNVEYHQIGTKTKLSHNFLKQLTP